MTTGNLRDCEIARPHRRHGPATSGVSRDRSALPRFVGRFPKLYHLHTLYGESVGAAVERRLRIIESSRFRREQRCAERCARSYPERPPPCARMPGKRDGWAAVSFRAWVRRCSRSYPACGDRTLPPFGQLRLHGDTDAPVPAILSRLRIDVFSDGRWIDSRDASLRDPANWPASFTRPLLRGGDIAQDSGSPRAYHEGMSRDYREGTLRLTAASRCTARRRTEPPPSHRTSRALVINGTDRTPLEEPSPEAAIDRLVRTTLHEGEYATSTCCSGSNALARWPTSRATALASMLAMSCCRPPMSRGPNPAPSTWKPRLDAAMRTLSTPRLARFNQEGVPLHDEEVVVPGGVLLLGSRGHGPSVFGETISSTPERIFVVPPMLLDRYEYTVARYRDAVRRGFSSATTPERNDLPGGFDRTRMNGMCTFSAEPMLGAESREEMPLSCLDWNLARSLCVFDGGDLPSEAEWEYAATAAARPAKTMFPWGDEIARCDEVVWGRMKEPLLPAPCLAATEVGGPLPSPPVRAMRPPRVCMVSEAHCSKPRATRSVPIAPSAGPRHRSGIPAASTIASFRSSIVAASSVLPRHTTARSACPVDRGTPAYDAGFRCARH